MLSQNYVRGSQPDSHYKGGGRFPLLLFDEMQIFVKAKHYLMSLVLCYGEVLRFFKTSQSFDQITTLTYIHMDNFLLCLSFKLFWKYKGILCPFPLCSQQKSLLNQQLSWTKKVPIEHQIWCFFDALSLMYVS